jgi:hypothetical protein
MLNLSDFNLASMTSCGAALRRIGNGAGSMEEVSDRIVRYFHDEFINPGTGEHCIVLARFFKTISYADLEPGLRDAAQ